MVCYIACPPDVIHPRVRKYVSVFEGRLLLPARFLFTSTLITLHRTIAKFEIHRSDESLEHWFLIGVPPIVKNHFYVNYKSRIFLFIIIMTLKDFYNIFQTIKFKYI